MPEHQSCTLLHSVGFPGIRALTLWFVDGVPTPSLSNGWSIGLFNAKGLGPSSCIFFSLRHRLQNANMRRARVCVCPSPLLDVCVCVCVCVCLHCLHAVASCICSVQYDLFPSSSPVRPMLLCSML